MEAAKFGHDFGRATKVTVPSLDDWEKEWNDKTMNHGRRMTAPKLVAVDFRSQAVSMAQAN